MKADSSSFKKSSAAARVWDEHWARFAMGLSSRGVDPARHEFCRIWVRKFLAFIKPRKFEEAVKEDVAGFVVRLLGGWQGRVAVGPSGVGVAGDVLGGRPATVGDTLDGGGSGGGEGWLGKRSCGGVAAGASGGQGAF